MTNLNTLKVLPRIDNMSLTTHCLISCLPQVGIMVHSVLTMLVSKCSVSVQPILLYVISSVHRYTVQQDTHTRWRGKAIMKGVQLTPQIWKVFKVTTHCIDNSNMSNALTVSIVNCCGLVTQQHAMTFTAASCFFTPNTRSYDLFSLFVCKRYIPVLFKNHWPLW